MLVLTNVSANIAIPTLKMALAMFAEMLVNTKHSTLLSPEAEVIQTIILVLD
jgi:hypothetical protein